MTDTEHQELDMLREFYASWKDFHRTAAINGVSKERKQQLAQTMVEISRAIELVRTPVIAMASG